MKGQYTIQLFNKQGELVQETTDNNMLTNAISNLLNPSPLLFAESTTPDYENYMFNIVSNIEKLMGGVMLWSENIPEDPNMILPPNIESQIGYAGNDGYTGNNAFRGSYNAIESGKTATGYKFVFDFPTSTANGVIKCVTLTSAEGGKCGWGGDTTADITRGVGTAIKLPNSISGKPDYINAGYCLGQWEKDVFTFGKASGNNIVLTDVNFPINSLKAGADSICSDKINRNYKDDVITTIPAGYACGQEQWFSDKDKIVICTIVNNSTTLKYLKINPLTKEIVDQKENVILPYRHRDLMDSNGAKYIELDGYLYICNASDAINYNKILKINLSDTTQIEQIIIPSSIDVNNFYSYGKLFIFQGKFAIRSGENNLARQLSFYLNSKGEWISLRTYNLNSETYRHQILPTLDIKLPFALYSWRYSGLTNEARTIIYNAYLATINNLSTPITKTADVSMKIVCELTDVES